MCHVIAATYLLQSWHVQYRSHGQVSVVMTTVTQSHRRLVVTDGWPPPRVPPIAISIYTLRNADMRSLLVMITRSHHRLNTERTAARDNRASNRACNYFDKATCTRYIHVLYLLVVRHGGPPVPIELYLGTIKVLPRWSPRTWPGTRDALGVAELAARLCRKCRPRGSACL